MPLASDLISQHLPPLRGSEEGTYYKVSPSSSSTARTTPPRILSPFPTDILTNCWSSNYLDGSASVPDIYTEINHYLLVEGDVERAAALYLLHPVNIVLEKAYFPNFPNNTITAFECLGQHTMQDSRPDMLYRVNGKSCLLLEYKRTNTIRESDWTPALAGSRTVSGLMGEEPTLKQNALHLGKQATKYSRESETGLVVLFDYQNMVVLDFRPGGERWDDKKNPVWYLFSNGKMTSHRLLLLAVFIFGLKKLGIVTD